jgi:hypothetical protein
MTSLKNFVHEKMGIWQGGCPPENFVGASMSPPSQGNFVEKVAHGNLEPLLSAFLSREVASPCSPTATFLLEEVA